MPKKQTLLFILFFVLFVSLLGIQLHFLKNTYQLKEKEVLKNAANQLNEIENNIHLFDNNPEKDTELINWLVAFNQRELSFNELRDHIKARELLVNPKINQYIDSVFTPMGYKVAIQKEYSSIYSANTKNKLFTTPMVVYRTNNKMINNYTLSTGRWDTETRIKKDTSIDHSHKFIINQVTYYDVTNLNRIILLSLLPLILVSSLILLAVSVLYTITYRSVRRQEKQIEDFHSLIDNISHEFKTPIATLKIANKSLLKSYEPSTIALIDRQINRLEQLLDPLQANRKNSSLVDEQFVNLYLEDIKRLYSDVLIETSVHFSYNHLLTQVDFVTLVGNLLSNAVKYDGTVIYVNLTFDKTIDLIVGDNGIGIDKNEIQHVFRKYYRIQKNNILNKSGLGLGLYFIEQLVNKYNGTIGVESKIEKGTTITIRLKNEV